MGEWKTEGDYWRDGAVCVRNAFDDHFVERDSALEFVAGSHLGPWYMPRSFLDGEARFLGDDMVHAPRPWDTSG